MPGRLQPRGGDGPELADVPEARLEQALVALHRAKSKDWARRRDRRDKAARRCHPAAQPGFAQAAARLLGEGAFWREVVLLAVGRLVAIVGDAERPLLLAGELCPTSAVTDGASARRAWQAGEVLVEVGAQQLGGSEPGRRLAHDVPLALRGVLGGGWLEPVERAAAGDVLARLGDPRFRADAWYLPAEPLLGLVEIPAGHFVMGSDKEHDAEAFEHEVPQRKLPLPQYYIARYPVTVAQLRAFMDEGGQVRNQNALRDPATRPVRWVRWSEALAYADWLTEKLRVAAHA